MKAPRPRIARDQATLTKLGMTISKDAHARLREVAETLGIGQDHILTYVLERLDVEELREPMARYLADARKPQLDAHDVAAYLKSLPADQRESILKGLK